jgi:hypothetical protein
VGGGAYLAGKHRANAETEQQQEAYSQGQQDAMAAPPPPASSSPGMSAETMSRLQELGKLHEQGILTDEEFAQQKSMLLGTA